MAIRFRLCPNETTTVLRKHFNATPLRIPDASVQPFLVVAEKAGKTDKRGRLEFLLKGSPTLQPPIHEDRIADVALQRTRSMDWEIGSKLLEGFLAGFNLPATDITANLSAAREISLAFENVRRRWIDKNQLGSLLRPHALDLTHPAVGLFLGDDPWNMLLVTDVIVSNGIAITVEKSAGAGIEAKLPILEQLASKASSSVKVERKSHDTIAFSGAEWLTFAFSCVKLELDPATGRLGVGLTVLTRESTGGEPVEEPQPVELDDDLFEPGLLEWD
ncbi:MAG: hypothetical protein KatS3mg029_0933 [Saprospiraceae bacterium]|nr:MAG: hypothetical protein KatS3mg029_0933 [Saprospiraceae bacterium]